MRRVLLLIIFLFIVTDVHAQRLLSKDVDSIEVWANTAKDGSGTSYIPLTDADGHLQIDVLSGGGGGVQYTEADTDATITGTAVMWEDAADTLVSTSATKPLPVNIVSGSSSGTEFNEDTTHTTGDAGSMSLAVRNDGGSSLCGTDGDYCPLSLDANGSLRVTGGGGGTEYTEGNTDISITGGVALAEGPSDTIQALQVDASKNLQVDIAADSAGLALAANQLADGHNVTVDNASGASAVNVQDGGNSLTVDGTVTANLGTLNGAALDASVDGVEGLLTTIDADTSAINVNAATIETNTDFGTVTGGGVELGALRVTVANDSTGVISVDDNAGSLTVDGTVTANAGAGPWPVTDNSGSLTVDNAGTFAVQVSSALPTGANTIGNIGTIATSITPGTGSTNLGKAEDAAHATGHVGVQALTVRQDTATALSGTNADYQPLITDSSGRLHVNVGDGTVTANLGTLNGAATAANQLPDGHNVTVDNASGASAVNIQDGGNSLTIDGSVGITGTVDNDEITTADLDTGAGTDTEAVIGLQFAASGGATLVSAAAGLPVNIVAGSSSGTEFNEDTAHTTGDAGSMMLGVRVDSAASLCGADGDYCPPQFDANGALRVTGGGGGTEYTVNAVAPTDPTGATFTMERDDALSALAEVEGDWTNPRANANGALWVSHDGVLSVDDNATTLSVDDGAGSITVDGTVTANAGTGPWPVTDNAGSLTVDNSTLAVVGGGTEATAMRVTIANDSTGLLSIDDNGSTISIDDNAGSLTVDGTITANLAAGTNNIGDVDIASAIPAGTNNIGDVDVVTQPARDNATDTITVSLDTAAIMNDTTALTPKFAVIDEATSGDNTVVAAVASRKIRVLSLFMICAGDVDARFESGAGGTALSGQMDMTANSGFVLPFNPVGWFETGVNTLLNLELSAAISCDGSVVYVEV